MDTATANATSTTPGWAVSAVRRITAFPGLITAIIVVKVFWTCGNNIADPDIWWHLRNAQYLVTNLRFPNVDTYSFTTGGVPWLNHEWLSEMFYYAAFRGLGLTGIFLVFATALSVMLVAVFCLSVKASDDPFAAAITTIAGGALAMVGFGPRTQHFGWLCFVAMYAVLLRFRLDRRAPLWLLPPIFAVWINCHGSWLIGLLVYAIFVLAGLIPRDIGRLAADPWAQSDLKKLMVVGVTSVAALFANPFGYRLVLYPFDFLLRVKIGVENVQEFASVNFNDATGRLVAVVLGVVFATALMSRNRWRIDDALLTVFVLYCGLTHNRFLLLAGIVLPPIMAPHFAGISSYHKEHERRLLNAVLLSVAVAFFAFGFPSVRRLEGAVADSFPQQAVAYLRTHPQQGRMFNWYEWGGYLEWNIPEEKTFIDSRTDIFEYRGVLKDYWDVATLIDSQEILARYQVSYVLLPAKARLSYHLSQVPQWQRVYSDGQAVIFRTVQR